MRTASLLGAILVLAPTCLSAEPVDRLVAPRLVKSVTVDYSQCERQPTEPLHTFVRLDEEGNVTEAEIVRAPTPCIALTLKKALRDFEFSPATLDGRPVEVHFSFVVQPPNDSGR